MLVSETDQLHIRARVFVVVLLLLLLLLLLHFFELFVLFVRVADAVAKAVTHLEKAPKSKPKGEDVAEQNWAPHRSKRLKSRDFTRYSREGQPKKPRACLSDDTSHGWMDLQYTDTDTDTTTFKSDEKAEAD